MGQIFLPLPKSSQAFFSQTSLSSFMNTSTPSSSFTFSTSQNKLPPSILPQLNEVFNPLYRFLLLCQVFSPACKHIILPQISYKSYLYLLLPHHFMTMLHYLFLQITNPMYSYIFLIQVFNPTYLSYTSSYLSIQSTTSIVPTFPSTSFLFSILPLTASLTLPISSLNI